MQELKRIPFILLLMAVVPLLFIAECSSGPGDNDGAIVKKETGPTFVSSGVTHKVPTDFSTIQAAIDAAGRGDTIVVQDGIYKSTGNKNLNFKGKAIQLRSENGPDNCVIDCEGTGRGFFFHSSEAQDSIVDGLTVRNAFVSGPDLEGDGGGFFCYGSSPTIINCIITENRTGEAGGGISCYHQSSPIIKNCTFSKNKAPYGGAVCLAFNSSPIIENCIFSGNRARGGDAIYCGKECFPTVNNCTFIKNSTYSLFVEPSSKMEVTGAVYK
jgi:hypothetical protein